MKRNATKREKDLIQITRLALEHPVEATSLSSFIKLVATELGLSTSQAKRDILELRKIEVGRKKLNYEEEVAKKRAELALLKERSLKQGNLNAYLGAIKCESEILNLKAFAILDGNDDKAESNLEDKKKEILELILKT